jgi:Flp pilus assembly protein TadD
VLVLAFNKLATMGIKSDSENANGVQGRLHRMQDILFGITCALVIGIYCWSAQSGYLDLTSSNAGDSYYNLLVQGFRHGQLNVYRDPPPGLASLANPYDPVANNPFVWKSQYLCYDMSYYQGKLYLYFGATPALVLFWPYVAVTDHYLPQADAVVIFFIVGFLVSAGLIHAIWRRYFPGAGVAIAASGVVAMGLVTGILELLASCDVYETPKSCGFAFTMIALAGVWKALHEPHRKTPWLVLASLAYGLAVASRQSLLFGAVMLLAPSAQAWFNTSDPHSRRSAAWLLLPTLIPITLVGIGLMLYNNLRFDNPFEFGWHYQLVGDIQNTTARQLSAAYLWFNFRFYFLEPMHWTSHFPFLDGFQPSPMPVGYAGVGPPYSGIFVNYPIIWLALAAPLALRRVVGKDATPLHWFAAALFTLFLACSLVICLFLFASSNYELDFLPDLMLLPVIGIFGLERALEHSTARRWLVRGIWCLLLAYSIFFNAMASAKAHASADYITGNSFVNRGKWDEATGYFKKASLLDPGSATFHFALANALSRTGQADDAIVEYQKALAIKPDDAEADNNLAYTLLQSGRVAEAITYFQRAVKIEQNYEAYYNLGYAYRLNGMAAQAMDCYRQALKLQPQFRPAQINLAWMLATWPDASLRNGNQAVALAGKASQSAHGMDPKILRTLAAAYAEAGQFTEAVATAKQALALVSPQSNVASGLQAEIQLYEQNSPLRTTGD